jgi:hypothetical protein
MSDVKRPAGLSVDLDNKWSYLKTHGDPGWDSYPSYLEMVVPRLLEAFSTRGLTATFFIVGQDAALERNRAALRSIAEAGHEIGNHSFKHEPWLHLYSESEIEEEFSLAEQAIERATGRWPVGFRGPGFSFSATTLRVLARRGYRYDASTFPSFLGPLARAYYFMTSKLSHEEKLQRANLFGGFTEGFRRLKPYQWSTEEGPILELPVTTMPLFKLPIHASYLLYLSTFSPTIALAYFRFALRLCRLTGTAPSILLHPLDFLGGDDDPDLAFFPAMGLNGARKVAFLGEILDILSRGFEVMPLMELMMRIGSAELPDAMSTTPLTSRISS